MKRKFVRFLICVMFGVMLFAVPSGAKDYDNGNFCINCSLTYKSSKATGTTNGAPSNYYNRVLVYTRNKNGNSIESLRKQVVLSK